MKRGDSYFNFGGEKITLDYVEATAYVSRDTQVTVRGVDNQDAGETLSKRSGEFRDCGRDEVILYTEKYQKAVREEQR